MSQHGYEFTGIFADAKGLVVCFTEVTPAWTRFRTITVPYDSFTDRHVRMVMSHYKRSPVGDSEVDTPIPDIG